MDEMTDAEYLRKLADWKSNPLADRLRSIADRLESPWVSVEDRLPEPGHWYLAWSGNCLEILLFDGVNERGNHWWQDGDWGDPVTHWQPIIPPIEAKD